jgi:hypothetical protein
MMRSHSANRNWIPVVLAFAPAFLLPLTQEVLRPAFGHAALLGVLLDSAPNFVVGLCFPFSILVRPRTWTPRVADNLFAAWCFLTLAAEAAVEYLSPFGPNIFDVHDLIASGVGIALAVVGYAFFVRQQLGFAASVNHQTVM